MLESPWLQRPSSSLVIFAVIRTHKTQTAMAGAFLIPVLQPIHVPQPWRAPEFKAAMSQPHFTKLPLLAMWKSCFSLRHGNPGFSDIESTLQRCIYWDYSWTHHFKHFHWPLMGTTIQGVDILFSRGSSWPRDRIQSPALRADSSPSEPPGKPTTTTQWGIRVPKSVRVIRHLGHSSSLQTQRKDLPLGQWPSLDLPPALAWFRI